MNEKLTLIYDYLDGHLSDQQEREFEVWLREHPDNVRLFVRVSLTHSCLSDALRVQQMQSLITANGTEPGGFPAKLPVKAKSKAVEAASPSVRKPEPSPPKKPQPTRLAASRGDASAPRQRLGLPNAAVARQDRWPGFMRSVTKKPVVFAAAICLAVVIVGSLLYLGPEEPVVATLTYGHDLEWADSGHSTVFGSGLHAGWMTLTRGDAEITMGNGTTVLLDSPCTFELTGASEFRLERGALAAIVRPADRYFTVNTPNTSIVDLGTRFGVKVSDEGATDFAVFEGKVELRDPLAQGLGSPGSIQVTAGFGGRVEADATVCNEVVPLEPSEKESYASCWQELMLRPMLTDSVLYVHQRPASLSPGELPDTEHAVLFPERLGLRLSEPLNIHVAEPGFHNVHRLVKNGTDHQDVIAADSVVDCYLLHFDPARPRDSGGKKIRAGMAFAAPIKGVIFSSSRLHDTDSLFGMSPMDYNRNRGLEDDAIEISEDRRVVIIHFSASIFCDQMRIITESTQGNP